MSHFGRCGWVTAVSCSAAKPAPVPCGWGRARASTDAQFPRLGLSARASPDLEASSGQGTVMGQWVPPKEPEGLGPGHRSSHWATMWWCSRGSEKRAIPTVWPAPGGWEGGCAL